MQKVKNIDSVNNPFLFVYPTYNKIVIVLINMRAIVLPVMTCMP
jgi:hypothetical protein